MTRFITKFLACLGIVVLVVCLFTFLDAPEEMVKLSILIMSFVVTVLVLFPSK